MGLETIPSLLENVCEDEHKQATKLKWPELLVIVRHGQSEQNVVLDLLEKNLKETLGKLTSVRDADIALTEKGIWQAEETGKCLASYPKFDECFISPYKRTIQTAEAIIKQLPYNLNIFKDNRLREKEFGKFHGLNGHDIEKLFPEEFVDRKRDGKYWYRMPRGENYPDVETRVHDFLNKLVRDCAGKRILVVTHQVPYKLFRALFEHLDEKGVLELPETPNCGIQRYISDTSKNPEGRMKLIEYDKIAYGGK